MKRKLSFLILSGFVLALLVLGLTQAKNAPETWLAGQFSNQAQPSDGCA